MTFSVRLKGLGSSVRYRIFRDGRAMRVSARVGSMVHTVSMVCPSVRVVLVRVLYVTLYKVYPTTDSTTVRINIVWSWKRVICSIIGEAASSSDNLERVAICYLVVFTRVVKVWSAMGVLFIHSRVDAGEDRNRTFRFVIIDSHMITTNINTASREIEDP